MAYRILAVGEVLWDLLPDGKQLGGAPANFTYHCRSLGAEARLVTRVGDDELGREILGRFRRVGIPTETIQVDPEAPTGTVDVAFDAKGQPSYTIVENVAWDRIAAEEEARGEAAEADAVCFGSLAQRGERSRRAIRALVGSARPGALRVFDVNLRPPFVDRGVIAESLELADVLKLNDQELVELSRFFGLPAGEREGVAELARRFGLKLVALTRGSGGSLLLADGAWSEDPGRPTEVIDTIGAGDSFTAALVIGYLAGRPLDAIHRHAGEVAAFVCSRAGGMPPLPEALRSAAGSSPESLP